MYLGNDEVSLLASVLSKPFGSIFLNVPYNPYFSINSTFHQYFKNVITLNLCRDSQAGRNW